MKVLLTSRKRKSEESTKTLVKRSATISKKQMKNSLLQEKSESVFITWMIILMAYHITIVTNAYNGVLGTEGQPHFYLISYGGKLVGNAFMEKVLIMMIMKFF